MKPSSLLSEKKPVRYYDVEQDRSGQRIDNFLFAYLKNIPKSRIYQMIRKGEVRVNGKRIQVTYRLQAQDRIRIPPLIQTEETPVSINLNKYQSLLKRILFENEQLLVIDKPAGIPVHAGGAAEVGIVEALRLLRTDLAFIELAHRIDKDTSGCLVLAKKRSTLKQLHQLFREGLVQKTYWALVMGQWPESRTKISKNIDALNWRGSERVVKISEQGKESLTYFKVLAAKQVASLIEAKPKTGRMHQIRVHTASAGHPIACDEKYGDDAFNRYLQRLGLKRLFLHAKKIEFILPDTHEKIEVESQLAHDLTEILQHLQLF